MPGKRGRPPGARNKPKAGPMPNATAQPHSTPDTPAARARALAMPTMAPAWAKDINDNVRNAIGKPK